MTTANANSGCVHVPHAVQRRMSRAGGAPRSNESCTLFECPANEERTAGADVQDQARSCRGARSGSCIPQTARRAIGLRTAATSRVKVRSIGTPEIFEHLVRQELYRIFT